MNRTSLRVIIAFASILLGALPSCGDGGDDGTGGCTLIGCGPAFRVELTRSAWSAGVYEVVVEADTVTTNCTVKLPFTSCDSVVQCDRPDPGFFVEASGCALPAGQHSIPGVSWNETGPKKVTVTVLVDGTVIGTDTFEPTYTTSEPNGAGCGPVCMQSDLQAKLSLM